MDFLHLINVITAYRPTAFAKKLKAQTRAKHDAIESHPFIHKLITGDISAEEYFAYIENLSPIYTIIENRLLQSAQFSPLHRDAQITEDIRNYQDALNIQTTYKLFNSDWVNACIGKTDFELISDFYIRWLGDLYGGQIMSKNFKYNYMLTTQDLYSVWSGAVTKMALESPEDFRRQRHALNNLGWQYNDGTIAIIEHAGWHFTYLGGDDFARTKIQSFAHAEDNRPEVLDRINIEESIRQGRGIKLDNADYLFKPVKLDDYLPATVINNQDTYADKLLPADVSARDFLPK